MTTQDSEKTEKPVVEKPNADRPAPVEKPASTPEPNQGQERSEKDAKWQKEQTEAAKADAERKKLQGY